MQKFGGRYSIEEVTALVNGYQELRESKRSWIRVRLLDVERALEQLDHDQREAVLLVGMLGKPYRAAASYTGKSHQTMARRYHAGLEAMVNYLNRR